ncbi:unnamed protein product [Prorocentrum cordatum]|uniref:Uncharacterized protein n=1 Tax=Prorocentrum cordatum TaxID=2364126 RepID=A0ABN9W5N4_9DINO|nr:unnamed protein product [Polarella glacialis]
MRGSGATPRSRIKIVLGSLGIGEGAVHPEARKFEMVHPARQKKAGEKREASTEPVEEEEEEEDEERLMSWELQGLGKRFEFTSQH